VHRHWPGLTRPALDLVRPRVVVEVGSRAGDNSRHLLAYCRDHGAHLHVIDPAPIGNQTEIAELLAAHGTHHQDLSLNVLAGLAADMVILDGDHNWYTVLQELRTIEDTARQSGRWPVCLLHDVGWPYGRRDGYYAPERIPAEARQASVQRGLAPGRREPLPVGGFNARHHNAIREGGPRNGVLTAVEDFIVSSRARWELAVVPEFHGAGILFPVAHLAAAAAEGLHRLIDMTPAERERRQAAETARLRALAGSGGEDPLRRASGAS